MLLRQCACLDHAQLHTREAQTGYGTSYSWMYICMEFQITFIEFHETRALLIAVLQKQFYRVSL